MLRRRFGLDRYITHWFVSADLGVRKPDPRAYDVLLQSLNVFPSTTLFIDDRGPNLLPAQTLGLQTALFTSDDTDKHLVPPDVPRIHSMASLAQLLITTAGVTEAKRRGLSRPPTPARDTSPRGQYDAPE